MGNEIRRCDLDLRHASAQDLREAAQPGIDAALRAHKEAGVPIVVWRDGRIVEVPAEAIEIPTESATESVSNSHR